MKNKTLEEVLDIIEKWQVNNVFDKYDTIEYKIVERFKVDANFIIKNKDKFLD